MFLFAPLAWALLTQVPPTTIISGVVVDSAGSPVAGAEVWWADQFVTDRPKAAGPGRADAEGKFSIATPATTVGMPTTFSLWAYAPGHRLGLLAIDTELPKPGEPVRIEIGPPAKAVVRVEPPNPSATVKGKVEVFAVHRRYASLDSHIGETG
jgi:hypothetical protein